jgi:hypothetical protein
MPDALDLEVLLGKILCLLDALLPPFGHSFYLITRLAQ